MSYKENFSACLDLVAAHLETLPEGHPVTFPAIALLLGSNNRVLSAPALSSVMSTLVERGLLDRMTSKTYRKHMEEPPQPKAMDTLDSVLEALAALTTRVEFLERELGVKK